MASVLDRKIRRELWAAKGLILAIVSIIVIGISYFISAASAYLNLTEAKESYYAQCRMADVWIDIRKAPEAELEEVALVPGVSEVRSRIGFQVTIDLEDVAKPLSGLVLSHPDEPRGTIINDIVLRHGGHFTPHRRDEVIINDAFARARGIVPGDTIHVLLNNRRQQLFVVGTAISSEFVYIMAPGSIVPDPANYAIMYIKRSFAEEVLDFEGAFNQVVGLLTPSARDHPQAVADAIEDRLDDYGVFATTTRRDHSSHRPLSDEIDGLRVGVVIVPGVFLSVAALILNILMLRVTEQQRTTIGTFKALGYSNGQMLAHFLQFGLTVGVIGGLAGVLTGHFLAGLFMGIYRQFYEFPELPNRFHPSVHMLGVLISVACAAVGTWRGVRLVVRLQPAEAMRPKPPVSAKAIWLEHFRRLWTSLGFQWHMIIRGVVRNRGRTGAGLFAAAMGASLVYLGFCMADAIDYLVEYQYEKVLLSDYELTFKDEVDSGALLEVRALPGVDYAEPLFVVACMLRNGHHEKKSGVTGLYPGARLTIPRSADMQQVAVPETGLLLTRRLAELLDVDVGQDVELIPIKGARRAVTVPVANVVDSYLGLVAYADFHYLNRLVGEEEAMSGLQLEVAPGHAAQMAFYRELKEIPRLQAIVSTNDTKDNLINIFLGTMQVTLGVIVLFAGVLFFGSILNSSLISLSERRREIATFRVLGYDAKQVGRMFLRESLLVHVSGALLGLPLGYGLVLWLSELFSRDYFRMPAVTRPINLVWAIVLAVLFTLAAHWFVQRAINRLEWADALNIKE